MDNKQIRVVMRDNNIYMWQVAKKLNVNETSFCKWFREELSEERKQQVMSAIEEIKLDRKNRNDDEQLYYVLRSRYSKF